MTSVTAAGPARFPAVAGLAIALAVLAVLSTASLALHQLPWSTAPQSIHLCGQDFELVAPAEPMSTGAVLSGPLPNTVIGHVWTWRGRRAVRGVHAVGGCGDWIYADIGNTLFLPYLRKGA